MPVTTEAEARHADTLYLPATTRCIGPDTLMGYAWKDTSVRVGFRGVPVSSLLLGGLAPFASRCVTIVVDLSAKESTCKPERKVRHLAWLHSCQHGREVGQHCG